MGLSERRLSDEDLNGEGRYFRTRWANARNAKIRPVKPTLINADNELSTAVS